MKKPLLLLLFSILISFPSFSQEEPEAPADYDKNLIKVNLTGFLLKNYGFQYERMLSRKTSFALGVRTMPKGDLPLMGFLENQIDDPDTFKEIERVSMGNFAVTPEFRFYLGKKSGPRGFYIAPYLRYSKSDITVKDFEFTYEVEENGFFFEETRTLDLNGDIKGITGGLMFGAQWKLGKSLYLDWWIIGGSYGSSNGTISTVASLTQEEQDGLRNELNSLDIPVLEYDVEVNSNGAKMTFDGPFASLRGGLSLGIKF
ncbi:hypothetical protein [Algoriphagus sp. CAU 1675]|uniref:hypothetical protein n=1 Tax=Algoriphagus sp. CAU 1675 TaxID=3032597 RepID=UPI0023DCD483|nr:hypothetical protein [Algoriphagus sp. CAU 1675]MDF2157279.1 hypothetical protein [Algoriphagus sp. CAU 1675]